LSALLPASRQFKFLYLGDTARCPYGNRSPEEIILFAKQIVDWLISAGADRIVMACNTSAAVAGATVKVRSSVPVHDLIHPTAEYLAERDGKVAVLATASTVRSAAFSKAIARLNYEKEVLEIGCPELVPLVESGQIDAPATRNVLWNYVKDFQAQGIKSVVLGCTHYPFLAARLAELLPSEIELVDPAEHLLKSLLNSGIMSVAESAEPYGAQFSPTKFFVTGPTVPFSQAAAICLGRELVNVTNVTVEDLISFGPPETRVESAIPADAVAPAVSTIFP
jgi:glutamate racemase